MFGTTSLSLLRPEIRIVGSTSNFQYERRIDQWNWQLEDTISHSIHVWCDHKNQPNVGKHSIDRSSGFGGLGISLFTKFYTPSKRWLGMGFLNHQQ